MFIKKILCTHEYHLLTSYKAHTQNREYKELFVVYCPKCKNEKTLSEVDYDKLMAKQKVINEYKDRKRVIDDQHTEDEDNQS